MIIRKPFQKTIDHIVAECPEVAKTESLHRHDKAATYLHWNICKELNIGIEEKWYEHEPHTIIEKDNITQHKGGEKLPTHLYVHPH